MDNRPIKPDCLKVKETMFDFLRRKKQHQLQQSLKQFDSASKSNVNKNMFQSGSGKKTFSHEVVEQPNTIPLFSNRKSSLGKTMSVTPRKITFGDENEVEKQCYGSARRPLIERISANKNIKNQHKMHSVNQRQHSTKNPQSISHLHHPPNTTAPPVHLPQSLQPFIRRKLQLALSQISEKLFLILQTGRLAFEKNSQLSVELVKFVVAVNKEVGTGGDNNNKYGGLVRLNTYLMRWIQHYFTSIIQLIEEFSQSLGTLLHDLQTTISTNLHQHYQQKQVKLNQQKSIQISQLQSEIIKLEREMGRLNRQMEKQERDKEGLVREYEEKVREVTEQLQRMRVEMAEKDRQCRQKMQEVLVQLSEQKQQSASLSKQLKAALYEHQQSIQSSHCTYSQQLHSRQFFLLSQLQSLKLTFTTDISQLHKLYQSKHLSYEQKITQLTKLLSQEKQKSVIEREVGDKIIVQANNSRMEVGVVRKQNGELKGELRKVGDDLYRHWLALGDIKVLSTRLNIYRYFEPIYMDLHFDPSLFSLQ